MKLSILAAALLASIGFMSTSAMAEDSATISSTATVRATCNFIQHEASLNFGVLDPASQLDATATASLDYQCTRGSQALVTLNGGSNSNQLVNADSSSSIEQSLTTVGGNQVGLGYGLPLTYNVSSTIAYDNYKQAKAGLHNSTMIVTIAP